MKIEIFDRVLKQIFISLAGADQSGDKYDGRDGTCICTFQIIGYQYLWLISHAVIHDSSSYVNIFLINNFVKYC